MTPLDVIRGLKLGTRHDRWNNAYVQLRYVTVTEDVLLDEVQVLTEGDSLNDELRLTHPTDPNTDRSTIHGR